jgi:hypothetical protein
MHYFFQLLLLKGFPDNKSFIGSGNSDEGIAGAYPDAMIQPVTSYC